uniref:Uncharacterized protein n=1 Tax=Solanum lycopersicum TaxID=4081 RepID=A0A3Q7HRE8_SOLLC
MSKMNTNFSKIGAQPFQSCLEFIYTVEILKYLNLTRRSSLVPSTSCLMVIYTPGSSCSIHSDSISLALLTESEASSLESVVVLDASIYDISPFGKPVDPDGLWGHHRAFYRGSKPRIIGISLKKRISAIIIDPLSNLMSLESFESKLHNSVIILTPPSLSLPFVEHIPTSKEPRDIYCQDHQRMAFKTHQLSNKNGTCSNFLSGPIGQPYKLQNIVSFNNFGMEMKK